MSSIINLEEVPVTPMKRDPAWKHVQMFKNGKKEQLKCIYCMKLFNGGGIYRVKEHLACRKGNGSICSLVPKDVRFHMQQSLEDSGTKNIKKGKKQKQQKQQKKQKIEEEVMPLVSNQVDENDEVVDARVGEGMSKNAAMKKRKKQKAEEEETMVSNQVFENHELVVAGEGMSINLVDAHVGEGMSKNAAIKKRKKQKAEEEETMVSNQVFENHELVVAGEGMSINVEMTKNSTPMHSTDIDADSEAVLAVEKNALGPKGFDNDIKTAIGQFLYYVGAPFDAVNSVYFKQMVEAISSRGSGFECPSQHELRGWVLKYSVEEMKNDVERCRLKWGRTGCSILVDQLTTEAGRVLLNFFACFPDGIICLKTFDSTEIFVPAKCYELIRQIVEEIGVGHVLQVITPGEELYAVAGKWLTDTFPTLFWSPSAAYCIDLIFEDFGNLEWISIVIEQARSITRFVYNCSAVLSMVRRYTLGNDIVDPAFSHSSTNFSTIKRFVDLKHKLQTMITSQEWMDCPYSKKAEGLEMLDILSDKVFWSSCQMVVRLTAPLLGVLRIATSELKPAMGYIYAGIYRAKEAIKKALVKREDYMVYWNIIHNRWERLWNHPLHAAGFYLNPKFFYSIHEDMQNEILSRLFDCIERLVPDTRIQDKIVKEITLYKTAAGDFGRKMAIRARNNLLPTEWWSTYGGGCPNLSRLSIRILSQTCSLPMYKRNQMSFEQKVNSGNFIVSQHLSDLAFVQHNLQLRQMLTSKEQNFSDPLSFNSIGMVEEWIRPSDLLFEENGSSYWMVLDPSVNSMLIRPSNDEAEELGEGFDDDEIFNYGK
ncbi:uncharacterized protein LOC107643374 isoform X2 [Arachis ipaensis]|uniref:BED-type domain-containing protein n=1 Tax=Arachis hypogaea TaxID=3818 RepID=A0A444Z6S0_ARAHY|nr:uncharacterized protein LOC107643374 isoform X2 [Arachis ipaensis]XP_025654312.1 uncharacterized protein LOC112750031 isoform X2 [Arachis hypogaea]RYR09861.1 hypothetical protein Ahy_B05g078289 [Arachis hypogaea]